ncbi:hypothetical protein CCACVL1_15041 [Corchorus capsularis]|uniref:Uncharacterized protein n=1 Tax=Corchorus capsularis TaxID=210143 RepID=A0A1R3I495_COCAP|nr:hypothetical protein CCACVL1_15041 [Corchorus capsularis]
MYDIYTKTRRLLENAVNAEREEKTSYYNGVTIFFRVRVF